MPRIKHPALLSLPGRDQLWAYEELMGRKPPEPYPYGTEGEVQFNYTGPTKDVTRLPGRRFVRPAEITEQRRRIMPMSINDSNAVNRILDYIFRDECDRYGHPRPSEQEFRSRAGDLAESANKRLMAGWTRENVEKARYWVDGLESLDLTTKRHKNGTYGVYLGKFHPRDNNEALYGASKEECAAYLQGVKWALEVAAAQPPDKEVATIADATKHEVWISVKDATVDAVYSDHVGDVHVVDFDYREPRVKTLRAAFEMYGPKFIVDRKRRAAEEKLADELATVTPINGERRARRDANKAS